MLLPLRLHLAFHEIQVALRAEPGLFVSSIHPGHPEEASLREKNGPTSQYDGRGEKTCKGGLRVPTDIELLIIIGLLHLEWIYCRADVSHECVISESLLEHF